MRQQVYSAALAAAVAATVGVCFTPATARAADQTTSFQYGVNGYSDTVDMKIYSDQTTTINYAGSYYGVDGYNASNASPDAPMLLRFDSLFGTGPGQIPVGAYILDAQLQLTSHNGANSQSGGAFGVSPLVRAFNTTDSNYASFDTSGGADIPGTGGNRGPWWENNTAARPIGSYNKPAASGTTLAQYSTRITSAVQAWSNDPTKNYGLAIQTGFPGTSDAWDVRSMERSDAASRPKLTVKYTTDPVNLARFQQGVNGYTGSTSAYALVDPTFGDATDNGDFHDQDYIDGNPVSTMLIKYDNVFGASSVPSNAVVRKAYLVINSGDGDNDRSGDKFELVQLHQTWDTTTKYHDFGANGPDGTVVDSVNGIIRGQEVWFDVTQSMLDYQSGTENDGWFIRDTGGDGWQIRMNGSVDLNMRPELMVAWTPAPGVFVWNLSGGGNWGASASWTGGGFPNQSGASATFGSAATADTTVNVDTNAAVGSITFDNAHSYTLAGTGTITLNTITGPGAINVASGSHTISAPVALAVDTTVTVTPAASVLTLSNLAASTVAITKAGAGTLAVNNVRANGLAIDAGTVKVTANGTAAGVSNVASLSIAAGAKLDLTNNKLVVGGNATGSWNGTAYTGVAGLVASGRNNGTWDGAGIGTSSASGKLYAIGVASAGDVKGPGGGTWAGQTVAATDTLVMFTYAGDANLDGKINIDDYGRIDGHVAVAGATDWSNGDFNYDGKINIDDYGIIDGNIGAQGAPFDTSGAVAGVTAVPEPASLAVLGLVAPLALRRRRNRA